MFRGWVGANVPMNITNTVSGLDYHNSYDLYLYSSWGWTENTVNYEVIDGYGDSLSGSVTETRANILGHAADDYSGCVEGQNYIVISNVTPTVAGEIVFTGKCNDGIMSGLQIREHPGAGYLPPAKILSESPTGYVTNNMANLEVVLDTSTQRLIRTTWSCCWMAVP
jgi:hypothetical protein